AADDGRDVRSFAAARPAGGSGGVVDHQSEWIGPFCVACLWKNSSNTFSAAGAAASPPWPPFSISAQTTRSGEFEGPYPHHHDWLNVCMYPSPGSIDFSAVPVLPAIGIGTLPKIAVDVPSVECVASNSPSRTTASACASTLVGSGAGGRGVGSTRPALRFSDGCSTSSSRCGVTSLPPFAIIA